MCVTVSRSFDFVQVTLIQFIILLVAFNAGRSTDEICPPKRWAHRLHPTVHCALKEASCRNHLIRRFVPHVVGIRFSVWRHLPFGTPSSYISGQWCLFCLFSEDLPISKGILSGGPPVRYWI